MKFLCSNQDLPWISFTFSLINWIKKSYFNFKLVSFYVSDFTSSFTNSSPTNYSFFVDEWVCNWGNLLGAILVDPRARVSLSHCISAL